MKTLATPLATIHGGTPATETAKAITWLAMPGHQLAPGKSADLSVAIGPLPTLSTMQFTIVSTYADGSAGPVMPPASLTLTPDTTGQVATAHDHTGTATGTTADTTGDTAASDEENAAFASAIADATRGPSIWSIGGWVIAGLALLAGAIYFLRGRHRAEEDDEPDDEDEAHKAPAASAAKDPAANDGDEKQPVTAGKWSLRE
jgi:hypothetical protein